MYVAALALLQLVLAQCLTCQLFRSQNQGQTALHFAMSYNFHELGSWLVDEDGGKADDGVLNRFGLGPYDGLQPEG